MELSTVSSCILTLHREFAAYTTQRLQELGLSFGLIYFVIYVGKHPDCTPSELTKDLHLDWGHSQRSLNKLAEDGFLTKEKNGRSYHLKLTQRGENAFVVCHQVFIDWDAQSLGGLTAQERQQLLQRAGEAKVPVTLIGNGSNLLVRDKGIRGLVIKLGNMLNDVAVDGCTLTFGSGVSLAAASRKAAELGLSGMEFAVGIPGSIGGAVYMNAGAYDGEMAKVVTGVRVMELDGTISELPAAALDFGYRHTALQGSGKIVTAVTMRLTAGDKQAIADKMADFSNRRITKQPLELPSAGSMFKRPPGYFAGTLIDQTGLKGYTVGGAQVSEKHAGFVVNIGGATAADVLQLICDVQDKVFAAHGVHLEPEVLVLGEE